MFDNRLIQFNFTLKIGLTSINRPNSDQFNLNSGGQIDSIEWMGALQPLAIRPGLDYHSLRHLTYHESIEKLSSEVTQLVCYGGHHTEAKCAKSLTSPAIVPSTEIRARQIKGRPTPRHDACKCGGLAPISPRIPHFSCPVRGPVLQPKTRVGLVADSQASKHRSHEQLSVGISSRSFPAA